MNLFIYALAALFTLLIAVRSWQEDPSDPRRLRLFSLGLAIAGVWTCFALFLAMELELLRVLRGLFSLWAVFAFGSFLDAFLGKERPPQKPWLPWALAGAYSAGSALGVSFEHGLNHWIEIALGTVVTALLLREALGVLQVSKQTTQPLERARLRSLLVLLLLPVGLVILEAIGRLPTDPTETGMNLLLRVVKLQGVAPPASALASNITFYILGKALDKNRLLDLDELIQAISHSVARVGSIGAAAATLGAVTLVQLGPSLPGHTSFQALLALILGLLATDPVRVELEKRAMEWLNQRGQRLYEAADQIELALARVISVEGLAGELLGRLVSSGRIATAMLYVWDEERNIFRLIAQKGKDPSSLTRMAGEPLREAVPALGVFVRPWLELERQHHPEQERAAGLLVALDGLKADAVLPLRVGQTILGWLVLSDGDGGGFSVEEIHRLERLAARATILLENLHDFERLKEMHRLAALGTMAAGLAHEIRNPLAGIKGAAQYLQAEEGPPDREMVQVIVDEADRLNVVVSQFLDYARPLSLQLEPLRLEGLIAQVANLFRAQGLMDVVWKEDLTADLPLVPADAPRLKQVLLNLCQNAVQAMRGGGTLTLRTRLGRLRDPQRGEQPCVELSVEDSGCGISKEDLEQLFIPFFTTRPDGTGLGLPICQRIVQAHHGELDVHTEIGKGSTFILRLPL